MKKPLGYCLIMVLLISLSEPGRAQSHKKKHRSVHRSAVPAHINYRPAGWSRHRPAYTHPPLLWEGYRYYTYHRYYAHPYKPVVPEGDIRPLSPDTIVSLLPQGTITQKVGDDTYYYYGGIFYMPVQDGYQVIKAPAGAIVYDLPGGCSQIRAGAVNFLQYNGDYYLPVQVGGRAAYEVVNIEY